MDYINAQNLATEQQLPIRRSSWSEGRHVRHNRGESVLQLHEPGQPDARNWRPDAEDNAAQDWEQYMPRQQPPQEEQEQR